MVSLSRKEFIHSSALLAAATLADPFFLFRKKDLRLSFSTLGCPDWSFVQIVDFAQKHGYQGIEVRGLKRQMDLTLCPEFSTEAARTNAVALMKQKGLSFVGLGSSANLHLPEGGEREKNLAEARRFIDLAQQLACPYVRVFPNAFPKEVKKETTIDLIVAGLRQLGEYAHHRNVMVLMETHGDVVWADDLLRIMQGAEHAHVGLVWDVSNMWTVTKESPVAAYQKLKRYIHHTHIKDAKLVAGKPSYTLLGEGEVPIFEAIDVLRQNGYKGFYSFEWEKLWHPQLPEPGLALAHYPKAIKKGAKK